MCEILTGNNKTTPFDTNSKQATKNIYWLLSFPTKLKCPRIVQRHEGSVSAVSDPHADRHDFGNTHNAASQTSETHGRVEGENAIFLAIQH